MVKLLLLVCLACLCRGGDWSSLYAPAQLEAQQPRLQTAIDYLIQKEIQPFIPAQETTAFGLQTIDLPLTGFRTDPLDFYSQDRHIELPVETLLFVEDLSRAYGWLWANRLSTKTVDEYLSMLRYRNQGDFAEAKFPAPLVALHIPETSLSDPRVVAASVRLRRTAYAFLILHQFAHLQLHHEGNNNRRYTDAQEEEADSYALNLMKGNSVTPTGLLVVLYGEMYFEAGSGQAIHPVTPRRLEAMSHFLDARVTEFIRGRTDKATAMDGIHSIASLLVEGSEWLSVKGHQEQLQQLARKTDPNTLEPRALPHTTR